MANHGFTTWISKNLQQTAASIVHHGSSTIYQHSSTTSTLQPAMSTPMNAIEASTIKNILIAHDVLLGIAWDVPRPAAQEHKCMYRDPNTGSCCFITIPRTDVRQACKQLFEADFLVRDLTNFIRHTCEPIAKLLLCHHHGDLASHVIAEHWKNAIDAYVDVPMERLDGILEGPAMMSATVTKDKVSNKGRNDDDHGDDAVTVRKSFVEDTPSARTAQAAAPQCRPM